MFTTIYKPTKKTAFLIFGSASFARNARPFRVLVATFMCVALTALPASLASAATKQFLGAPGILTGASGVSVDGVLYDVEFLGGPCSAVFGDCGENGDGNFLFDSATAFLAAQALLDQVLLDDAFGPDDSDPSRTRGCELGTGIVCNVLVVTNESTVVGDSAQLPPDGLVTRNFSAAINTLIDLPGPGGDIALLQHISQLDALDGLIAPITTSLQGPATPNVELTLVNALSNISPIPENLYTYSKWSLASAQVPEINGSQLGIALSLLLSLILLYRERDVGPVRSLYGQS